MTCLDFGMFMVSLRRHLDLADNALLKGQVPA